MKIFGIRNGLNSYSDEEITSYKNTFRIFLYSLDGFVYSLDGLNLIFKKICIDRRATPTFGVWLIFILFLFHLHPHFHPPSPSSLELTSYVLTYEELRMFDLTLGNEIM